MMHTYTQILFNERLARRTEFACVARVNLYARSTSVRSFVESELYELIPRCVRNTFGEAMILDHASDVQIFKGDDSEHGNESMTKLMSEVAATVSNALMDASRCLALLFSLRLRKCFLIRAKEARVSNFLPIRECCKRVQAHVNPYRSITRGKGLRFRLNREAREPLACCGANYGKRLNLAFNGAVQFDSHISNFRQAQLAIIHTEAGLSIGERIISLMRTEARKTCFLLCLDAPKESIKRFLHSFENILQDLTVDARDIFTNLFDVWQLIRLLNVADRLSFKPVGVASFLQTRVVEFAQQSKRSIHARSLSARRKQPILIGFSLCYIFVSHVCHVSIVSGTGESRNAVDSSVSARLHSTKS